MPVTYAYPRELPSWIVEGHVHEGVSITDDAEYEQGEDRARQIYTWAPQIATVTAYFTQEQFNRFDQWYETELLAGANRFEVPVASQGGYNKAWWTAQFIAPYTWAAHGSYLFYRVDAQLLLLDGPNASASAVEALRGRSFTLTALAGAMVSATGFRGAASVEGLATGRLSAPGLRGSSDVTTVLTGHFYGDHLLLESGDDLLLEDGAFILLEDSGEVPGGSGEVSVSVEASRTTGAAPLSVEFNARGTTVDGLDEYQVFHWCEFEFDYDNAGAGTWTTNGLTKESSSGGPSGGTVYSTNGTKTCVVTCTVGRPWTTGYAYPVDAVVRQGGATYVCLTAHTAGTFATDLSGGKWSEFNAGELSNSGDVSVSVSTEAAWFTNRYYFHPGADYSGAPAGYTGVSSMPSVASDTVICLAYGQTYSGFNIPPTVDRFRVRGVGAGSRPYISGTDYTINIGARASSDASYPISEDISLINIETQAAILQTASINNLQIQGWKCVSDDMTLGWEMGLEIGGAIGWWRDPSHWDTDGATKAAQVTNPEGVHIVDCEVGGVGSTNVPNFCLVGTFGPGSMILGNTLYSPDQHCIRIYSGNDLLIEHNRAYDSGSTQHCLKFHASGTTAYSATASSLESRWNVVRTNFFGASTDTSIEPVSIRPENAGPDDLELVRDLVFEANTIVRGAGSGYICKLVGQNLSAFSNVPSNGSFGVTNGDDLTVASGALDGFNPSSPTGNYSNLEAYLSGLGYTTLASLKYSGQPAS